MKVSMSLPGEDVAFLDAYARTRGFPSRSAVLHKAVRLLRAAELTDAYEDAWAVWAVSDEADLWEGTVGDGVNP
ncbi:MAG TPA: ribbon-helix-helix domain-containing protein [Candidatus Dormibacteraeota bacterium]